MNIVDFVYKTQRSSINTDDLISPKQGVQFFPKDSEGRWVALDSKLTSEPKPNIPEGDGVYFCFILKLTPPLSNIVAEHVPIPYTHQRRVV